MDSTTKPPASQHPTQHKRAFQNTLIRWFKDEAKDYPWRNTTDPWAILVSEIMLQQTQVSTVLGKNGKGHYARFMALYPTPTAMASASEQEILKAWEGLGYYRRARNLHAAAKAITTEHQGIFPSDHKTILELPGIGRYTAGAVSSFAYNKPQPIVDANVSRVFSRIFDFQKRIDTTAGVKQIWQWAEELVHPENPRAYNGALMELGQSYCSNKSPCCKLCPIRSFCLTQTPQNLPIKKKPQPITHVDEWAIFTRNACGQILLQQQKSGKRREGMWSLPRRSQAEVSHLPILHKATYSITRYRVSLHIHSSDFNNPEPPISEQKESWFELDEIQKLPMPSPDRRALKHLIESSKSRTPKKI